MLYLRQKRISSTKDSSVSSNQFNITSKWKDVVFLTMRQLSTRGQMTWELETIKGI